MVWSQEEIDDLKARRVSYEGHAGKVDGWATPGQDSKESPVRSPASRKWKPTPTDENRRSEEWIGTGSPMGKKRSWKVKSIKPAVVVPDLDE
jgi:hypothetical protein